MTWFVVILSVLAVCSIVLLLFLELMGNDGLRSYKLKHTRGKYINDQTAVICTTIKDTADDRKAYILLVEYMFTNFKQFLSFVKSEISEIEKAFRDADIGRLQMVIDDVKEMKTELKDQTLTQRDCMDSIDPSAYIEVSAWIHLAENCRFGVIEGLRHVAENCIDHFRYNKELFIRNYDDKFDILVVDIRNMCTTIHDLIGTGNIEEMRELRKRMSVILSESYSDTQRLYELLHDGRSNLPESTRATLRYVLNVLQEFHCMIYTLRRFVLCNICLSLSLKH